MQEMDAIGSHAGISCPECHGPIWNVKSGAMLRYRCHVGHAYTGQTMMQGQVEAQEVHLWQALRLMKERASLLFEMQCHAKADSRPEDAGVYAKEIRGLQKNIGYIQGMIRDHEGDSSA